MNAPMSYSEVAKNCSELSKNYSELAKNYSEVIKNYSEVIKQLENAKKEEQILRGLNTFLLKEKYDLQLSMSKQATTISQLKTELKEYVEVHVRNTTEILKLEEKTRKYELTN